MSHRNIAIAGGGFAGVTSLWHRSWRNAYRRIGPSELVKKSSASEGRSRSAGAQDRFVWSETERKPRRGESQVETSNRSVLKYMRIHRRNARCRAQ